MQLHPNKPGYAVEYTIKSLDAGYIGLDFAKDTGDLTKIRKNQLPDGRHDYWDFAHEMKIDEYVLIIVHHFPFALATIAGNYNYIRERDPNLGVWFRHFRRVKNVKYYFDHVTNAEKWQRLTMTDTISPLLDTKSESYKLIEKWKD
jgi:hypothetical protein